jgi:hypothetical protein
MYDTGARNGVRAGMYTEFAFGFPENDSDDSNVVLMINRQAGALNVMRQVRRFSLNLLRADQLADADAIVKKTYARTLFDRSGAVPWLVSADAIFFCIFRGEAVLGDPQRNVYNLVFASIESASENANLADPLVNHVDAFWRLHRPALGPVIDPLNKRLLKSP